MFGYEEVSNLFVRLLPSSGLIKCLFFSVSPSVASGGLALWFAFATIYNVVVSDARISFCMSRTLMKHNKLSVLCQLNNRLASCGHLLFNLRYFVPVCIVIFNRTPFKVFRSIVVSDFVLMVDKQFFPITWNKSRSDKPMYSDILLLVKEF